MMKSTARIALWAALFGSTAVAFQSSCAARQAQRLVANERFLASRTNDDDDDDDDDANDERWSVSNPTVDRRRALSTSVFALTTTVVTTTTTTTTNADPANALDLTGVTELLRNNKDSSPATAGASYASPYRQARRPTAYLVDSTIPPTLVPFKANREAAILKTLGSGSGTSKSPLLDESLNLNNIMKKAVDGVGFGVRSALDSTYGRKQGPTFVFLGTSSPSSDADAGLAADMITDLLKPRARSLKVDTAIGLASVPRRSGQPILDAWANAPNDGAESADAALLDRLETDAAVPRDAVAALLPVLRLAKRKGAPLLALGAEKRDVDLVRREGLQSLDLERRAAYVRDAEGFVSLAADPSFRLYADRSLLKDFVPVEYADGGDDQKKVDGPGDFFAQRILEDEAVATSLAEWAATRPRGFAVVITDTPRVRYMGGANGRLPRVLKYLDKSNPVDAESVTTILLNPTAKNTLSQSRFLRLEIGTSPDNMEYQTKVADYLWFSTMPKVNMLPRLMRGT